MIKGMSRIWITFEMNSQNTKAIGGSNCKEAGANMFQVSQIAVHPKTIKKNPMEPTRMVIHNANLSSGVIFSAASLFMSLGGLRRLITSATDGGRADVVDVVVLMNIDSVTVGVSWIILAVISAHCLR
jgi:hypothetical protein